MRLSEDPGLSDRKAELRSWMRLVSRQLHLNQSQMGVHNIERWWKMNFGINIPVNVIVKDLYREDKK